VEGSADEWGPAYLDEIYLFEALHSELTLSWRIQRVSEIGTISLFAA